MSRTLILLLLLPLVSRSQGQRILQQDYSFLVADGEVTKLHQGNDTLYELEGYIDRPCRKQPAKHYKIISSHTTGEFVILKLELFDTIPLTTDPSPTAQCSILILKDIDNKRLGCLPLAWDLTREQLDTVQTNVDSLKNKFFFTFFSDTYLKELAALKKVTTKEEAMEIIEAFKSNKFKPLAESYAKTQARDMYGSGFSAELFNRICIEKGYSPIGAGLAINRLMKQ